MIPFALALSAAITLNSPAEAAPGGSRAGGFAISSRTAIPLGSGFANHTWSRPTAGFAFGPQRNNQIHFGGNYDGDHFRRDAGIDTHHWDRRFDQVWNHHHYRWLGNSWVIIDSDYAGFGDPDSYASPEPVTGDSLAAEVQQALADQGYYRGAIDVDVGPETRAAIAFYQRAHHQPETGRIDTRLLSALNLD